MQYEREREKENILSCIHILPAQLKRVAWVRCISDDTYINTHHLLRPALLTSPGVICVGWISEWKALMRPVGIGICVSVWVFLRAFLLKRVEALKNNLPVMRHFINDEHSRHPGILCLPLKKVGRTNLLINRQEFARALMYGDHEFLMNDSLEYESKRAGVSCSDLPIKSPLAKSLGSAVLSSKL